MCFLEGNSLSGFMKYCAAPSSTLSVALHTPAVDVLSPPPEEPPLRTLSTALAADGSSTRPASVFSARRRKRERYHLRKWQDFLIRPACNVEKTYAQKTT